MRQPAIRNVVLVGPSGAGKTTVAEAMLQAAGAIHARGSVEKQTTVSDHTDIEHELDR